MTPHRRTRCCLAAVTTGFVLTQGGCGSDEPPASTPPPSSPPVPAQPSPTTPAPVDQAKQEAVRTYLGMWNDMAEAARTSNWRSPEIAHNATGEALRTLSRSLYADHYNGLVTRGHPVNHPEVAAVEQPRNPVSIRITDCGDSTSWLKVHADTGEQAHDGPGGHRYIEALVRKATDGSWKVTTFAVHEVGSCGD